MLKLTNKIMLPFTRTLFSINSAQAQINHPTRRSSIFSKWSDRKKSYLIFSAKNIEKVLDYLLVQLKGDRRNSSEQFLLFAKTLPTKDWEGTSNSLTFHHLFSSTFSTFHFIENPRIYVIFHKP
jgi:hypothetical protein